MTFHDFIVRIPFGLVYAVRTAIIKECGITPQTFRNWYHNDVPRTHDQEIINKIAERFRLQKPFTIKTEKNDGE